MAKQANRFQFETNPLKMRRQHLFYSGRYLLGPSPETNRNCRTSRNLENTMVMLKYRNKVLTKSRLPCSVTPVHPYQEVY